jgi:hypothetical protein
MCVVCVCVCVVHVWCVCGVCGVCVWCVCGDTFWVEFEYWTSDLDHGISVQRKRIGIRKCTVHTLFISYQNRNDWSINFWCEQLNKPLEIELVMLATAMLATVCDQK